jgi:F420-dependent oxidoreductase-like protein
MKIAVSIGGAASGGDRDWPEVVRYAVESERLGADFCWSAEAWGQDCVAPLAYLAARTERMRLGTGIMQISARVPSMAAMTAMTMAAISGDRFVLGLGVSGPQVVEGLQGVPFARPLGRLTEYLDILDLAFAGRPLDYQGEHYVLPRPGGEGKVLRLAQRAGRKIPVYLATLGPRGLELTGARADGWVGNCFIPEASAVFIEPMRRGAEQASRRLADLDLQAGGPVRFGDDLGPLLASVKRDVAFRLGAMGSKQHNFYNLAYRRAGFEAEARRIQELWLAGHRDEATQAVPDEMARLSSFVGTDDMVRDRIRAFRAAGITTIRAEPGGRTTDEKLGTLERFARLVREENNRDTGAEGDRLPGGIHA